MFDDCMGDCNLSSCHCCSRNQSSHIQMIANHGPICSIEWANSFNDKLITSYSANFCSHTHKHITHVLRMRLTSSIVDNACSLCKNRHQNKIFSSCYRRKPLPNIFSFQLINCEKITSIMIIWCCSHLHDIINKCIHWTSSQLTSLWIWHLAPSESRQKWSCKHHSCLHFLGQVRIDCGWVDSWAIKNQTIICYPVCLSS